MIKKYYRRSIDPRDQYRRWIDPRFRTLRLADVISYVQSRGWEQMPPDREGFLIFREPPGMEAEGGPFYQFVPDSEEGDDYALRVFEFLTGLAEIERRQASEVIDDILQQASRGEANGASQVHSCRAETRGD